MKRKIKTKNRRVLPLRSYTPILLFLTCLQMGQLALKHLFLLWNGIRSRQCYPIIWYFLQFPKLSNLLNQMFYYVVRAIGNFSPWMKYLSWPPLPPRLIIYLFIFYFAFRLDLFQLSIFGTVSKLFRTLLVTTDINPTWIIIGTWKQWSIEHIWKSDWSGKP